MIDNNRCEGKISEITSTRDKLQDDIDRHRRNTTILAICTIISLGALGIGLRIWGG